MINIPLNIPPAYRQWAYRVANAALALAVGYRVVEGDHAALWLILINALLGLADANVPTPADPAHTRSSNSR